MTPQAAVILECYHFSARESPLSQNYLPLERVNPSGIGRGVLVMVTPDSVLTVRIISKKEKRCIFSRQG